MEKFNHEEYRDDLAEKLKGLEDHRERKAALDKSKNEKNSKYFKAKLASERDNVKGSKIYKDTIEQINGLENASAKMFFAVKQDFDYKSAHQGKATESNRDNGIFDKESVFFNEKCKNDVIEELKSTIRTPEQLDIFLSKLMLDIHEYFDSHEELSQKYRGNLLGHGVNKILIPTIIIPVFMNDGNSSIYEENYLFKDFDLDWWYVLGKHLNFNNSVRSAVKLVWKKNTLNPRSRVFQEYLLSKGDDIEKW